MACETQMLSYELIDSAVVTAQLHGLYDQHLFWTGDAAVHSRALRNVIRQCC